MTEILFKNGVFVSLGAISKEEDVKHRHNILMN